MARTHGRFPRDERPRAGNDPGMPTPRLTALLASLLLCAAALRLIADAPPAVASATPKGAITPPATPASGAEPATPAQNPASRGQASVGAAATRDPHAGLLPAAAAPLAEPLLDRSGHGWFVWPVERRLPRAGESTREFELLHVVPRDRAGRVAPGSVRSATRLSARPEGLAAWGDRAFMIFAPRGATAGAPAAPANAATPVDAADSDPAPVRRVASVRAVRTIADTWSPWPAEGVDDLPALTSRGVVAAFAGTPAGPAALMRDAADPENPWRLTVFDGRAWADQPVPAGMPAGDDVLAVLAADESTLRLGVIGPVRGGADDGLWSLTLWHRAAGGAWSPPSRALLSPPRGATGAALVVADGLWVLVIADASGLSSWLVEGPLAVGGPETLRLTGVPGSEGVPSPAAALGLDGLGRLAWWWAGADGASGEAGATTRGGGGAPAGEVTALSALRVREVGLTSGRVLDEAVGRRDGVVGANDLRLLGLVVGSVTVAVLLFVLRSEQPRELPLPTGVALGRPGRRLAGAGVDLALMLPVACAVHGVAPGEILGWAILTRPETVAGPWVTWLGLVLGVSIACEALFGRTLGKRLAGVRVMQVRRAVRKVPSAPGTPADDAGRDEEPTPVTTVTAISPGAAVVRNLCRWLVPPAGVLMFIDPTFRHAADMLASTVVVEDDPEPPEEDASGPGSEPDGGPGNAGGGTTRGG